MKTSFSLLAFLFLFSFSGFGQVVDTAAVVREVDSLIQVSRALASKRGFDKALEINAAAEKLSLEKLYRESASYGRVCFNHSRILYFKGDYPVAEKWCLESKTIREKVLGKEHPEYAQSLNLLANLYMKMGNYEKAEQYYLESKAIREKVLGKEHSDYAQSLNNLAILYWHLGNYEKAELFYLESKAIWKKTLGKEHPEYAASLNNLAALYWDMGNYEKAEPLYLESKAIREKVLGKEHPDYAASLTNLALLYQNMGNYENAELVYLESNAILEKTVGKEHLNYAYNLNNLANLYLDMGNYKKAEPLLLESKAIRVKAVGTEHPDYALSLSSLAALYEGLGNYEKAEQLYLESKSIRAKALGTGHPEYSKSLNSLAGLYWEMRNYEKAEPLYLECISLREKTLGKEHHSYALSLNNLASLYWMLGKYEKAGPLYLESISIREKTVGKEHPEYAQSLNNLAILNWATGNFDTAESYLLEAGVIEKSLLAKATQHLSERELTAYNNQFVRSMNLNFSFTQTQITNSDACYDNTLFYKGFLINAVLQVNKLALTDSAAAENYFRLKSCRRRLATEYAKPIAERTNVAELEDKANTLEKELTRSVAGFDEALRQVNWQEVQAALKPDEAAIEFIRFHYYNPSPTDSILYAALLLKPGMESPAFISLFEEKQLDVLLAPLAGQGSGGLNELYSGRMSQSLYRLLWSPVESQLAGIKTIYYSPSGLMHRLNMGAIHVAEGKILADRYELVCLSSTRQLITTPAFAPSAGKPVTATTSATATVTATIFGGIQFDMDSTAYPVRSNLQDDDFNNRRGLSFGQTDSTLRGVQGDNWQYLKWSEKEADNIQSILAKAGIAAETRKGWQATEESFKQIGRPLQGDKKPSPRILHVSTHGFFFPDPKSAVNRGPSSVDREPVFKISDDPMIRSGLVLAGGNYAWKNGQPLGNREDGILTAYEISQLDLRNTDLVVLSACETGLGQIEGNEGVYGLQRAYKIAGVKYLVMSLWQVPDYQTQELMTAFYRNMLEGKMPVRQALHTAQNEMRQKRYEPFYWAGFVLVE